MVDLALVLSTSLQCNTYIPTPEAYLEPGRISTMEIFLRK